MLGISLGVSDAAETQSEPQQFEFFNVPVLLMRTIGSHTSNTIVLSTIEIEPSPTLQHSIYLEQLFGILMKNSQTSSHTFCLSSLSQATYCSDSSHHIEAHTEI